jgi:hypothetical protein
MSEKIINTEKGDNKFVNRVVLKKEAGDVFFLARNKRFMRCPHQPPLITQEVVEKKSSIATMDAGAPQPEIKTTKEITFCSSAYPLFQFENAKQSSGVIVKLCCGNTHAHYKIDEIIPYVEPKKEDASAPTPEAKMSVEK